MSRRGSQVHDEVDAAAPAWGRRTNRAGGVEGGMSNGAPIVVRAANHLGAHIEVSGLEGFRVSGAFWRFEGLDIQGVCASHPDCEHAFHVTGKATDFTLRHSRVRDFNAQLKVNAAPGDGGVYDVPHRGLIEYCDIGDTAPRATDSPVTKLNIDTGDAWVVRGNFLHDWHKDGGDGVSYGAFMKSGGHGGLYERNLVACTLDLATGGTRIGLSFGGGGTGAQYCAPAFDENVPCSVEHTGGLMRNNVIIGCNDVGIYLNRSVDTRILSNTLVGTAGIDFRFETTTGEADGNVLEGGIRERDGGTFTPGNNLVEQDAAFFDALYVDPLGGDFLLEGPADALVGQGSARDDVPDDFCARQRPAGAVALGAIEHSLGDCVANPPPEGSGASGAGGGSGSGGEGSGASGGSSGAGAPSAGAGAGAGVEPGGEGDDGCGCRLAGAPSGIDARVWLLAVFALALGRKKRSEEGRDAEPRRA
ncbi:MAG: chorismate synthase [Polyangiaceae bacterium]